METNYLKSINKQLFVKKTKDIIIVQERLNDEIDENLNYLKNLLQIELDDIRVSEHDVKENDIICSMKEIIGALDIIKVSDTILSRIKQVNNKINDTRICRKAFKEIQNQSSSKEIFTSSSSSKISSILDLKTNKEIFGLQKPSEEYLDKKNSDSKCKKKRKPAEIIKSYSSKFPKLINETDNSSDDSCSYKFQTINSFSVSEKNDSFKKDEPCIKLPSSPMWETQISSETKKKEYKCKQCKKCFKFMSLMKIHLRIHTGERPFKCNFCTKAFATKYYLLKHQLFHDGEGQYTCYTCKESFCTLSDFKSHSEIHEHE